MKKNTKKVSRPTVAKRTGPPTAISTRGRAGPPTFRQSPDGSVRLSRCEFVGSLTNTTTGFALTDLSKAAPGYDLNPACGTLFPWLSNIAVNYERFHFHKLAFRMIPSQATTTPGRVYCAIDYDYDDAVPSSKQALMSNQTAQEAPVWEELTLTANPSLLHPDMPYKYVTSNSRGNFVEPRTAYCGYAMFAFDSTALNLLYDLEVQYDVTLSVPVFEPSVAKDGKPSAILSPGDVGEFVYQGGVAQPIIPVGIDAAAGIQVRVPGSIGVPSLAAPGTTQNLPGAIDLTTFRGHGTLTSGLSYNSSGAAPSSLLTSRNPIMKLDLFDSVGKFLAELDSAQAGSPIVAGSSSPSWSTTGAWMDTVAKTAISTVTSMYPAAKWAVPMMYLSSSIMGAGKKAYYQFEF